MFVSSDFTRVSLLNPALKQVQKPRALAACKTLAGRKKVSGDYGELAASKTKLRVYLICLAFLPTFKNLCYSPAPQGQIKRKAQQSKTKLRV